MGNGKAVGSLICGVAAVLLFPLAIILGPIALFLGIDVLRRKRDGRGLAIAGISAAGVGIIFFVIFCFLAYLGVISPAPGAPALAPQPLVIVDRGFQLGAGDTSPSQPLSRGDYDIQVTSDDGLTIVTYASQKDLQLALAHGNGVEYLAACSATKSIRFHQTCILPEGAVFSIANPNFLQKINVNVKITKLR